MSKQGLVRDGSENALNAFVRGVVNPIYTKRGMNIQVLNVGALRDDMASLVLERLKKWQARGGLYEYPLSCMPLRYSFRPTFRR